ncbi:dehydrogenase/reductase SDR family member 7-like [Apostichopus japonicus]|uniref:dehydrogenase/reductase SDR family member 7-like n=1 Tax=Stichopus japonicus TaxID=307972 RepID=UPI003AB6FE6A
MEMYKIPALGVLGLVCLVLFPFLHLISLIYLLVLICYAFLIFLSDGDVMLMYYERFGSKGDHLKDKVVWITGGSGGLGEGLAVVLAKKGAKLILTARRESELERVKTRCLKESHLRSEDIFTMPMDGTDFDSHQGCVDKALAHFKKIDILVNNSGRSQRSEAIEAELSTDQFILHLNLLGSISITKCILPHMIENKQGHIVNISSVAGKLCAPCSTSYSASKFGMNGYFDTLRTEVYYHNIAITNVCPGPVATRIIENAVQKDFHQDPCKNYDGLGERTWKVLQTPERCVDLTFVAIANQLSEVWIAKSPMLIQFYISQYAPTTFRMLSARLGYLRVEAYRKAQDAMKQ